MFIIHGRRKLFIRVFEPLFYKCPYCESLNTTEVFIYSQCYHVFWIPIFPTKKIATAKCTECETFRPEERFGPKLTDHTKEELKNIKHPFYCWTLLIILGLLVFLIVIVAPKE
jgi:hypothetical protein